MRSASYSFSRVKLICDWIASACPEAMAADVACPDDDEPERDAAIASGEARQHVQERVLLCRHRARHVALRDVRDFVRQHGRKLGFALREQDEAGVHAHVAARQRERVDGRVGHGEELELLPALGDRGHEPMAELVQVIVDFGIFEVGARGADLAHDHFADLVLLAERHVRLRLFAKVGQRRPARGGDGRGCARRRARLRDDAVDPLGARCPDPEYCRHDRLQRERERREHGNAPPRGAAGRRGFRGRRRGQGSPGVAVAEAEIKMSSRQSKFKRRRLSWQAGEARRREPRRKGGATATRRAATAPAPASPHFTHFDPAGQAHMVDVGAKDVTRRVARAGGRIVMLPATLALIEAGTAQQGRRAGRRPHRGDPGRQAHLGAHPAVPPAGAHQGRRRVRPGCRAAARSRSK